MDYPVADDVKATCREQLIDERIKFICKFATKYKNFDLIETKSMYSLFDLSPYDELLGIDEKQDNCNHLIEDLKEIGEIELANLFYELNMNIRNKLYKIFKELPRCVFQGDENFSNLCVDENNHINGLFDFNLAGTEVIANYLANIAFQGKFYYTDEVLDQLEYNQLLDKIIESYKDSTRIIKNLYQFSEEEFQAYLNYSMIVMFSGYVNQAAFSEYLKTDKYKNKIINLLKAMVKLDLNDLI